MGQHDRFIYIVASSLLSHHAANQHSIGIGCKPGALHQPLVPCMGNIPGLMGDNPLPSQLGYLLPEHLGRVPVFIERRVYPGWVYQSDLAAEEPILVGIRPFHAGMLFVFSTVDLLSHQGFVIRKNLGQFEHGERLTLIGEEDGIAHLYLLLLYLLFGDIEDDRNAPDVSALKAHILADRINILGTHESLEGREKTVSNAHNLGRPRAINGQLNLRFFCFLSSLFRLHHPVNELATMR